VATQKGKLFEKSVTKENKGFERIIIEDIDHLEPFTPSSIEFVPEFNIMVSQDLNQTIISVDMLISISLETKTINKILDSEITMTTAKVLSNGDILTGKSGLRRPDEPLHIPMGLLWGI
jgi:hypothetical protein